MLGNLFATFPSSLSLVVISVPSITAMNIPVYQKAHIMRRGQVLLFYPNAWRLKQFCTA